MLHLSAVAWSKVVFALENPRDTNRSPVSGVRSHCQNAAMRLLPASSERCHSHPLTAATRILTSIIRRRVPALREPVVSLPSHGFRVVADLGSPFGLSLYRFGLCDPDVALAMRLLSPGDVFVDGGAHIGTFTLAAAVVVGLNGRVIACEPDPLTVRRLRTNVALNGFSWVDIHEAALTDHNGTAPFRSERTHSGLSALVPPSHAETTDVEVRTSTLDQVVGPYLGRVRLVKLDLEGAETQALSGAAQLLACDKPDMILEVEPTNLARQGSSLPELERLLTGAGYAAYSVAAGAEGFTFAPVGHPWHRVVRGPNLFFSTRTLAQPLSR